MAFGLSIGRGGGLNAGDVYTRVGVRTDDASFSSAERRLSKLRQDARHEIVGRASVKADTRGLETYRRGIHNVERDHEHLIRGSGRVRGALGNIWIGGASVAGAGLLVKEMGHLVDQFDQSEKVARRQRLVIRTMGQDAGETAKQMTGLSKSMERKIAVDDDAIVSTANVLRTFRNIRNEGDGMNRVFDRTVKATYDLSAAFGMDTQSAAIQLGKALNEPAKGAMALSRTGAIARSDLDKLKQMAKDGVPLLTQQKYLLSAVEAQVKGTAASNATATDKMKTSWGDFEEFLGKKLAPTWNKAMNAGRKFIDQIQSGKGAGGDFARTVKDIWKEVKTVGGEFYGAGRDVGRFFAHHPDLLKVAGTMAGIAGSVKVISKVGNLTGITGLFKLATGLGKAGGLGGVIGKAKPIPVYVVNHMPGGGVGGGPASTVARDAEHAAEGAAGADAIVGSASGGIMAASGLAGAAAIYGLGKAGATQYHSASAADIRAFGSGLGLHPASYDPRTGNLNVNVGPLPAKTQLTAVGQSVKGVTDKVTEARKAVALWVADLRSISRAPIDVLRSAAGEAVRAMSGARLSTKDLDTVIRDATRGAFGPMSAKISDTADHVEKLRTRLSKLDRGSDAYKSTAQQLQRAQGQLNTELIAAYRAGRRGAQGIGSIGSGASSASATVAAAAATIASNVDRLARQLGAQGVHFTPAATPTARRTQNNAFGALGDFSSGFAGGGWIGSRGERGGDTIPALLGAGEAVLNHHQQNVVEGLLGPGFLDRLFSTVRTPHYFAAGGRVPNVGVVGPAGGYRNDALGATRTMDNAAEHYIGKLWAAPLNRMISFGKAQASKHMPYVYGGGHGSFNGPYDCSGFVSAILHAGGLVGGPETTDGLKNYGQAGDGQRVTIGVRGSTGRSAHTMIKVGSYYFESGGSGGGAHIDSGWDGNFPIHRHPKGFARGGRVPKISLSELPLSLRERVLRNPDLLDPSSPNFIGFGLARGGWARFAGGGFVGARRHAHHAAIDAKLGNPGAIGGGFSGWEARIGRAEADYGIADRRYGLSTEDFIVQDANGAHVDQKAVDHRVRELAGLGMRRKQILDMYRLYLKSVKTAIARYRKAVSEIRAALKAVPKVQGKSKAAKRSRAQASKMRQGYTDRLNAYRQRLDELLTTRESLKDDIADSSLDLGELGNEVKALSPDTLAAQLPPPADTSTGDTSGGSGDSGAATGDSSTTGSDGSGGDGTTTPTTTEPPSALDVATAAWAQFTSFKEGAEQAFRDFGSNAVQAGMLGAGGEPGAVAGLRNFGAVQDSAPQISQVVHVTISDPADTHVFTQSALHELQAAL